MARLNRPWFFGALFIIAGFGLFSIFGWHLCVTCSPVAPGVMDCTMDQTFLGLLHRTQIVRGVTGAILEEHESHNSRSQGTQRTYRVTLVSGQSHHPLTKSFEGSHARQASLQQSIDQFLKSNPKTAMSISQPVFWPIYLCLVFPLAGIAVIRLSGGYFVMDGQSDRFLTVHDRLWGQSRFECALSEVSKFEVHASGGGSSGRTFRLFAVLSDHGEVPLTGLATSNYAAQRQLAEKLNVFLRQSLILPSEKPALAPIPVRTQKICVICGRDCSQDDRVQDAQNNYYHRDCLGAQ
jgi:hypothetical protein